MALPKMRPSFVVEVACELDEAMTRLKDGIKEHREDVIGQFASNHGMLFVTGKNKRFWSPVLDLSVVDLAATSATAKSGASDPQHPPVELVRVKGTFAPRPEIWTGLVFAIGTIIVFSMISFFFGIALMLTGQTPWVFWFPIAAVPLIAALYGSALVGQGLAGDNMYQLRAYVDARLKEAEQASKRSSRLSPDISAQL